MSGCALVGDAGAPAPLANLSGSVQRACQWPADLWAAVGVPVGASDDEVAEHCRRHPVVGPERLARKALLDPRYRRLYAQTGSTWALEEAGFFDDGLPEARLEALRTDTAVVCTPVHRLLDAPGSGGKEAVLLATGSFAPIHAGHLAMMNCARAYAQKLGWNVTGGYLSPSHDSYVGQKYGGTAALHAEHRLRLAGLAVEGSEWLMVDPWESRYAPCALNFTDVALRLERYLRTQLGRDITVLCVFGSDNLGFLGAFLDDGHGLCVERHGLTSAQQEWLTAFAAAHPRAAHLAPGDDTAASFVSSTRIRQGHHMGLPTACEAYYRSLPVPVPARGVYAVRCDIEAATAHWELPPAAHQAFESGLLTLLREALPATLELRGLALAPQREHMRRLKNAHTVVSLDPWCEGHFPLAVSRRFEVAEMQRYSRQLQARPGTPPLAAQLEALPRNQALLVVDDDTASGWTREQIEHMLAEYGIAPEFAFLMPESLAHAGIHQPMVDVVDARDFLLGAQHGGLVVRLPSGEVCRCPYMLPFVDLVSRASIPAERQHALSCALWALNADWHATWRPGSDEARQARHLWQWLSQTTG